MTICGADCNNCGMKEQCKGCKETNGCPFGKQCFIAQYINLSGLEKCLEFKQKLIDELIFYWYVSMERMVLILN